MLILVIGDPHFKENNALETEEMTEKILESVQKYKPDFIVCLGDVLDRHEKISLFALRRAVQFLEKLSSLAKTYVLIGNHDRPNNSTYLTDEHPFLACHKWENLVIVENVVQEEDMIFVPYVPPGRFIETIKNLPNYSQAQLIFAHQEFTGAKMGAITSTVEKWPEDYPLVISGHIHDYQIVQDNLIYTGTPIQHAFGDRDDKSISLFRIIDGIVSEERLFLECTRKKVITLSPEQLENFTIPKGILLKVILQGTIDKIKPLENSQKVKELRKAGVKVHLRILNNKERIPRPSCGSYFRTLQELIANDERQKAWLKKLNI